MSWRIGKHTVDDNLPRQNYVSTAMGTKTFALIRLLMVYCICFASYADDISDDGAAKALNLEQSTNTIFDLTVKRFTAIKARGTVWLRTQKLMDELTALIAQPHGQKSSARVLELANSINRDCDLIDNQIALEQARYLLSTLDKDAIDESSREAVLSMLSAADGEGALLLVRDLVGELGSGQ